MTIRRLRSLILGLAILGSQASAHDFWIDMASYRQPVGRTAPVRFLIGDIGAVEPWETLWRKIVSLRLYGPNGVQDRQASINPTTQSDPGGATVSLDAPGTYILAFESHQSENDIPAPEFNSYAEHEGLTPALAKRKQDGTTGSRGRELYSRRAKAIIQAGDDLSNEVTKPIGQTLEIVPERNPYALKGSEPLSVRIYYRGQPLEGASVVMETLDGAAKHGRPVITDQQGRAVFPFEKVGRWRVGVVWTQPITHPRAEFDTVFSTLTFGI